jgi:hypothetical protein
LEQLLVPANRSIPSKAGRTNQACFVPNLRQSAAYGPSGSNPEIDRRLAAKQVDGTAWNVEPLVDAPPTAG